MPKTPDVRPPPLLLVLKEEKERVEGGEGGETVEGRQLLVGSAVVSIGRKGTTLIIDNDKSISRLHATLTPAAKDSLIMLADSGSKVPMTESATSNPIQSMGRT